MHFDKVRSRIEALDKSIGIKNFKKMNRLFYDQDLQNHIYYDDSKMEFYDSNSKDLLFALLNHYEHIVLKTLYDEPAYKKFYEMTKLEKITKLREVKKGILLELQNDSIKLFFKKEIMPCIIKGCLRTEYNKRFKKLWKLLRSFNYLYFQLSEVQYSEFIKNIDIDFHNFINENVFDKYKYNVFKEKIESDFLKTQKKEFILEIDETLRNISDESIIKDASFPLDKNDLNEMMKDWDGASTADGGLSLYHIMDTQYIKVKTFMKPVTSFTPPTLKKDFRRYLYVMLSCISKDRYLKGCFRKASAEKIIIHSSGNSKKMTLDDVAIFYMKCDLASNLLNNYECKKSVMRTVFKQLLQSNCLHIIPFNKYYIEMTHLVLEHIPQYNDQMIFLDDLLHYYLNTNQN